MIERKETIFVSPTPEEIAFDDLLSAAKTGAKWMRWWLEQDECDCEFSHTCGRNERLRELKQMEAAIAAAEGR